MPSIVYWGIWFALAAIAPAWPLNFSEVVGITGLSLAITAAIFLFPKKNVV